jgi:hypothetical protein
MEVASAVNSPNSARGCMPSNYLWFTFGALLGGLVGAGGSELLLREQCMLDEMRGSRVRCTQCLCSLSSSQSDAVPARSAWVISRSADYCESPSDKMANWVRGVVRDPA